MPDVEKVISNVRFAQVMQNANGASFVALSPETAADVIELLKEQEPVECELEGGGTTWWYVCGDCHGAIDNRDSYCKHCGRKVKQG